jgi:hypothetical protein
MAAVPTVFCEAGWRGGSGGRAGDGWLSHRSEVRSKRARIVNWRSTGCLESHQGVTQAGSRAVRASLLEQWHTV